MQGEIKHRLLERICISDTGASLNFGRDGYGYNFFNGTAFCRFDQNHRGSKKVRYLEGRFDETGTFIPEHIEVLTEKQKIGHEVVRTAKTSLKALQIEDAQKMNLFYKHILELQRVLHQAAEDHGRLIFERTVKHYREGKKTQRRVWHLDEALYLETTETFNPVTVERVNGKTKIAYMPLETRKWVGPCAYDEPLPIATENLIAEIEDWASVS